MNNTTTIRTLMATIVVIVLNLTAGSLVAVAARSSSSSTPQPQNAICTDLGNNVTCSQGGIISNTTQIPLPTAPPQPQPSAILTIIKHVINDIVGTISAKDFTSSASGTNVSPQSSFPGAQSPGTTTAVVPDHNKCSSGGDIITCTHNNKETHHSAKDTTTPFVLPIPFP